MIEKREKEYEELNERLGAELASKKKELEARKRCWPNTRKWLKRTPFTPNSS